MRSLHESLVKIYVYVLNKWNLGKASLYKYTGSLHSCTHLKLLLYFYLLKVGYACVCMSVFTCVHFYVCMDSWGTHQVFSSVKLCLFFQTKSLIKPVASLAGSRSLWSKSWGYTVVLPHLIFGMSTVRIQTQVFMFVKQTLYPLSHLSSLPFMFKF